jgi:hypothetical protein
MSSFHVDARITLKVEYELAVRLGKFILDSGTEDKQILAMGHKLCNLDEDEEDEPQTEPRWTSQRPGWNAPRHAVPTPASAPAASTHNKVRISARPNKISWGFEK